LRGRPFQIEGPAAEKALGLFGLVAVQERGIKYHGRPSEAHTDLDRTKIGQKAPKDKQDKAILIFNLLYQFNYIFVHATVYYPH